MKSIARLDDVCTPAKDGTKNAFASMMAAQRERERVRSYALSYDESRRTLASHSGENVTVVRVEAGVVWAGGREGEARKRFDVRDDIEARS